MTAALKGFVELEFDLTEALLDRLVQVFGVVEPAPLRTEVVAEIPNAQGVYLLEHKGIIVYVGKTDGEAGLRSRLTRHAKRVQHRNKLNPDDVCFKAIRIYVFTVVDLETQLIRKFQTAEWNNSGFGSNDPGRERDTTKLKEDGFDAQFQIDIDRPLGVALPTGPTNVAAVLAVLKGNLPYVLRIGRDPLLRTIPITVAATSMTTRSILEDVFKALPEGWQATALAGRVIMYKEKRDYASGTVIARS